MKTMTRIAFLFVILLALAGCNNNGMSPGPDSGSGYASLSMTMGTAGSGDTAGTTGGTTGGPSGETTDDGDITGGDTSVHRVHNPEPASMLLWGVGLAGAAFLRRRKKA